MTPNATPCAGISFRLRRWFPARRENVFRAWTDPEALKSWWCPAGWVPADIEVDLRVFGGYRIGMRNRQTGLTVLVYGRFLEIDTPERLVYTWRWENAFHELPEMQIIVRFLESGTGTEVILIHEKLPEVGVCLRHRAGWLAAFSRMEAAVLGTLTAGPSRRSR